MKIAQAIAVLLSSAFALLEARAADAQTVVDPLVPVTRLLGDWTGRASGQAGDGDVTRSYSFVLNKRFIQESNVSRYPVQEKNKKGEVHEHMGMLSYDKARKQIVLRQFHVESFVTTYRMQPPVEGATTLVFESESFENFSNTWRGRETYEFTSDDEFTETFELAPPDKPFQVYSQTRFTRVKR